MPGKIFRYLADDHARLESLLLKAAAHPDNIIAGRRGHRRRRVAGDKLRASRGIGRHAGSNCQKTWLDFRVANKRYSSTSNLARRIEVFEIGGQQRRGLNGSLNSSMKEE